MDISGATLRNRRKSFFLKEADKKRKNPMYWIFNNINWTN